MTGKSSNTLNDRVTKLEVEVKSIKEDLKDFETLKTTSIEQSAQFKYIVKSLDEIKSKVEDLQSKPAVYWDKIITAIISIVLTAIVAHFIHF